MKVDWLLALTLKLYPPVAAYFGTMFSSPPRPRHDSQPLPVTIANLQRLEGRTRCEFERYMREYAAGQAYNRGVYAAQGESERKTWRAEEPQLYQRGEGIKDHRLDGTESPLLKARVHLREKVQEKEKSRGREENRPSMKIKEKTESDIDEEEDHKRTNKSRENGTRRKRDEDDAIREANERKDS